MTPGKVTRNECSGDLRNGASPAERLLPEGNLSEAQRVDWIYDGGFLGRQEVRREPERQIHEGSLAKERLEVLEVLYPGKVSTDWSVLNGHGYGVVERSRPSDPGDRFRNSNMGTVWYSRND